MSLSAKLPRIPRFACILAAGAALSFAQPATAGVMAADVYTISIAGFNNASGIGYILGSAISTVFGQTTTYAGAGYNGQAYTVSSYETVGATTTTDYFKISTPTSFLTSATVNGTSITALQLDIGTANSGLGLAGGANPVNFSSAVGSYTTAGYMVYGSANTVFTLTSSAARAGGGLSFSATEGVNSGTSAISGFAVHEFDFSITYANAVVAVPEPATGALFLAGLGLMGLTAARRKTR